MMRLSKVEGVKTNTPPKTNTYKRLPIANTLLQSTFDKYYHDIC
jgi:hypothetical protein